jgi:predicted ABC-type ATPase
MRVFAGPNGSGKSTVIESVRQYQVDGWPVDFGYYINADDIAKELRSKGFPFSKYGIRVTDKEFRAIALASGLINDGFPLNEFLASYTLSRNRIYLKNPAADERLAQTIADFLRKKLLMERKKFSFETVFSHPGKLDIMRQAREAGYKVYFYFVSTGSPDINIFRVQARKKKGGHDVPEEKIRSRYYRSLDQLYDASQLAYQAFFFDNSIDNVDPLLFDVFKVKKGKKHWIHNAEAPQWFVEHYSKKVSQSRRKRSK